MPRDINARSRLTIHHSPFTKVGAVIGRLKPKLYIRTRYNCQHLLFIVPIPVKRYTARHQAEADQSFAWFSDHRYDDQRNAKNDKYRRNDRVPPGFVRPWGVRHSDPENKNTQRRGAIKNK